MRILPFLTVFCSLATPALADTLTGRVVSIADGDTLTVLDSSNALHKIRLSGIDAPERGQPFGTVSADHVGRLVFGQEVAIQSNKLDRYGRIVGKVLVASDDALKQVQAGLAWHYKEYQHEQSAADRQRYGVSEVQARREHLGLWQDAIPIPPWEWRKRGSIGACGRSCADLGSCDARYAPVEPMWRWRD